MPVHHPLTDAQRSLLKRHAGTQPDSKVAKLVKCSPAAVAGYRRVHGIKAFGKVATPVVWTETRLRQLGNEHDEILAQRWGISSSAVALKRRSLNRPSIGRGKRERRLQASIIRQLGHQTDAALARQAGCGTSRIRLERERRGIPPVVSNHQIAWTAAMDEDLGRLSLTAFCRKHSMSATSARLRRRALGIVGLGKPLTPITWTPAMIADLGVLSDARVAAKYGISYGVVNKIRRRRGIAPVRAAR